MPHDKWNWLEKDNIGVNFSWLIVSYLCNRRQYVLPNSDKSEELVTSGEPSILGLLLFLILVNQLPDTLSAMSCGYADDFKSLTVNRRALDISAEKISEWWNNNSRSLNDYKCSVVNLRGNLATNNNIEKVKSVEHHKNLCIIVSKNMTCNENYRGWCEKHCQRYNWWNGTYLKNAVWTPKWALSPDTLYLSSATGHKDKTRPSTN